ncbi:hypothetical protein L208DRAFT_694408 [Tricholoma matsutake]|nr:hypothetical protein L208DRAFT_694408 [Tricholoma matsutake 945]
MSTTFDRRFGLGGPCGPATTMTVQAASYKHSTSRSSSFPICQHTQSQLSLENDSEMRTFSLNGPYGMNISLSTAIGGRFSITFPNRNARASSEPVVSGSAPSARSAEFITHSIAIPVDNDTVHDPTSPRAPSPAPTEIEDPDPEYILNQLDTLNIKVRDFAYEPPYTSRSPSTSAQPQSSPGPVPELFDQYKGIAEFEYRLAQSPRTFPIMGKTMRRLLDLEWVLYEEAEERLHEIDWEALREHDKKLKHGKPYPWRPCTWSEVPDAEGRKRHLEERGSWFVNYDKVRRTLDWMEEKEEKERKQAELAREAMMLWEMQEEEQMRMVVDEEQPSSTSSPLSLSKKRALHTDLRDASTFTSDDPDAKRPRLTQCQRSSQSQSQSHPPPPPKQYPAPLSSYDPMLYPDAKTAIELSAQFHPRPVVPPRADTPPAEEEEEEEEEERPGALVRQPKRLRRTLSRTQTFTQL